MENSDSSWLLSPKLEFSHSQFFVYDAGLVSPACEWTEPHRKQGFARRDRTIAVGALLEFGSADVRIALGAPSNFEDCERVLAVPLEIETGAISIDGPEEGARVRSVNVKNGHYRVTIAQKVIDEISEEISIWLERLDIPLRRSELLIADVALNPSAPLVETANAITL
jgi:hypothetical protein